MPGHVPGIHVFAAAEKKDVDGSEMWACPHFAKL
jgi:hypothetical protein